MGNPAAVRLAIMAGSLARLRAHLDAHPEDLRAWPDETWVTLAAGTGRIDIVEELLNRGLSVNEPGGRAAVSSPLAGAAEYPEMVRFLLDHGADPRAPRVMVAAAAHGNPDVVRLLLDRGGDPTVRSGTPPRNAYEQALRLGRLEIAEILKPRGVGFDVRSLLESHFGSLQSVSSGTVPTGAPFSLMLAEQPEFTVCTTVGLHLQELPDLPYRAEVFVRLPRRWPQTAELGTDPGWPVEWLLSVVHAGLEGPVLACWDTIGNGEPPDPLAPDVPFVGSINVCEYEGRATYDDEGSEVKLMSLLPLHPSELALGQRDYEKLVSRLRDGGVLHVPASKSRPSVVEAKRTKR